MESKLLHPFQERLKNLQRYREALIGAVKVKYPLSEQVRSDLKYFQHTLGLRDEDVAPIDAEINDQVLQKTNLQHRFTRQQFLKWIGIGGVGLAASVGINQVIKRQQPSSSPTTHLPQQQPTPSPSSISPSELDFQEIPEVSSTTFPPVVMDYTNLENLLKTGQLKDADDETAYLLTKAINPERGASLYEEHLEFISCDVWDTINQLWLMYSDNRFGFSVQKDIYLECGGTADGRRYADRDPWNCFGDRVGWRVNGEWIRMDTGPVMFHISAPAGHLPVRARWVTDSGARTLQDWETWITFLTKKIVSCEI